MHRKVSPDMRNCIIVYAPRYHGPASIQQYTIYHRHHYSKKQVLFLVEFILHPLVDTASTYRHPYHVYTLVESVPRTSIDLWTRIARPWASGIMILQWWTR